MIPGAEAQIIRVIRLVRVHLNWRCVENFWQLGGEQAQAIMRADMPFLNGLAKLCGGGSRSPGTCGALIPEQWWEQGWHISQKRYIYCPHCAKRAASGSSEIV